MLMAQTFHRLIGTSDRVSPPGAESRNNRMACRLVLPQLTFEHLSSFLQPSPVQIARPISREAVNKLNAEVAFIWSNLRTGTKEMAEQMEANKRVTASTERLKQIKEAGGEADAAEAKLDRAMIKRQKTRQLMAELNVENSSADDVMEYARWVLVRGYPRLCRQRPSPITNVERVELKALIHDAL